MCNTPELSRFVWGTLQFDLIRTLRLNSIRTELRLANRLPAWRIDNRGNDSCRFDQIKSNRQHFQPTLHSPPEVKIREITIQEPIQEPIQHFQATLKVQINYNQLPACPIHRRGNNSSRFDGIGFTNRFPVCRIANTKDELTLVGCIGQPSIQSLKIVQVIFQ